jgi:O-antigen ligase
MFKDRPIWGWGFGSHRYLYQLYARDEYRYPNGIVKHIKEFAHNDWMQFLAEFGVVGLFLLTAPACYVAWLTRRAWLRPESPSHWLIVAMALILFLATFEFPLSNPAVLVHFGILLTLALKIAWLDKNRLSRSEEKYE